MWVARHCSKYFLKAHGLKQSDIYRELTAIREFRNRIAHHEPICFNAARTIDTTYARSHYNLIRTYIGYMGLDPDSVLRAVEKHEVPRNRVCQPVPFLAVAGLPVSSHPFS